MRRTQIYLELDQSEELARRADVRGVTASHLIREAVAQYLADPTDDADELALQRAAVRDAAGAIPRLPPGAEVVERLREADRARDAAMEERWRSR